MKTQQKPQRKAKQKTKSTRKPAANAQSTRTNKRRRAALAICAFILLSASALYVWSNRSSDSQAVITDSVGSDTTSTNRVKVTDADELGQVSQGDKSSLIKDALNVKRKSDNHDAFQTDAALQNRAISMATGVVDLQSSESPPTIDVPILDDLFAKAGGSKLDSTYIALILGGCSETPEAIAGQFYDRQDSFARNPNYKKLGIGIGNLEWGCDYIAVLGE